mgnify:CR=1 FL=1|tara:strand:- start:274 stop:513 length:240 start_codon:yes stop_codon:yes gene_type:complete
MGSKLLEKKIEEIKKMKKKLFDDMTLIDDALIELDELENFVKNHETNQSLLERAIRHEKKIFPAKLFYSYYNAVLAPLK